MGFFDAILKIGSAAASVANPLTAIASPIVSLVEGANNRQAQREANAQNAAENQANRDFNAQQSAIQRQFEAQQAQLANQFSHNEALEAFNRSSKFQKEMWNAENAYNSPDAQIKRLMDAGLNPNLFGGDNTAGGVGSVSSSPASASMPHGVSASAGSSIPMAPISYTNPLLESANVRLANAQSRNIEANTDESKIRQKYLDSIYKGQLDLQNVQIHLGLSQEKVNERNADLILKEGQKLDKEMSIASQNLLNLRVQFDNLVKQGILTQKEIDSYDRRLQSNISLALSESAKNYGLANVSAKQCDLLAEQITHEQIQNGIIAIDFNKAFAGAESGVGLVISANENEQSYYDWASGAWVDKIWRNDNLSFGKKVWLTGSSYGNWLTHSIGVGLSGSFQAQPQNKVIKP